MRQLMRQLWQDIVTHRLVASLFALCWVGAWVITVITWSKGAGIGIPDVYWLFVVVASVIVGWWRMPLPTTTPWRYAHIIDSMRHGLVVAVVLAWLTLVTQEILSSPFMPAIMMLPSGRILTWQDRLAGVLFGALLLGILASVAGMLGGLVGGTLAYVVHRWRHRGGPAAPAGVS